MKFVPVDTIQDFTLEVYKAAPDSAKETYRKGLKFVEQGLPSFSLRGAASQVSEDVKTTADAISAPMQQAAGSLKEFGQKAAEVGQEVVSRVSEQVKGEVEALQEVGSSVADFAEETFGKTKSLFNSASKWVEEKAEELTPVVSEYLEKVREQDLSRIEGDVRNPIPDAEQLTKLMLVASPFGKALPANVSVLSEYLSNEGQVDNLQDHLSSSDTQYLRQKALEVLGRGDDRFMYSDWGYENKSVIMQNILEETTKNPLGFKMATLIGRTGHGNVRVEGGRVKVEDVYDFNSGPRGEKLMKALELQAEGKQEEAKSLAEESLEDLTYLGQLRVWAFALGVKQGEGTRFTLDLGPYDEKQNQREERIGVSSLPFAPQPQNQAR